MKRTLQFEFTVDKAANTVVITREFDAELSLVWEAFTKPELLDQWAAPAPFTARTTQMDFRVGGKRVFAMISPDGEEFWSVQAYTSITPKTQFRYLSNFADKAGNPNPNFKGSENAVAFTEADGLPTVKTTIRYETPAVLEMMVSRGFEAGTAATFENLDTVLAEKS